MEHKKYKLSFIAGSLLYNESIIILTHYIQKLSWEDTRDEVINKNILGSKTQSTAKRLFLEIRDRFLNIKKEDAESILAIEASDIQKQLLFAFVCNTYSYINDFVREVIFEKIAVLDYQLQESDYNRFFNLKSQWHYELDELSASTKLKIRQVLFRILREANIIDKNNYINMLGKTSNTAEQIANNYNIRMNTIIPAYLN